MNERRFYEAPAGGDARRSAPAALRNRDAIRDVLADWLPASGTVLEIASGTGEHAVHFAGAFPNLAWQPSDVDADALESIGAWRRAAGLPNLLAPIVLDAALPDWPIAQADAVVSINMVHISRRAASTGLIEGAARLLPAAGRLILYGPWLADDIETAPGNLVFDADLKRRDPEWGLRRVEHFAREARVHGLHLHERRAMPANNLMLLFERGDN